MGSSRSTRQQIRDTFKKSSVKMRRVNFYLLNYNFTIPSMLWRCWLGGSKGIWPVKNCCWRGYLSGTRCRLAYLLTPLPLTVSCFSKIQIGFTFLVPAHLSSPGKRAVKRVCVCVCVIYNFNKLSIFMKKYKRYGNANLWIVFNAD